MSEGNYVIAYDIGTTGNKTCLFNIADKIRLVASCLVEYPLTITEGGKAEQSPADWWASMCKGTAEVLEEANITAEQINGISFCSQMQGLVLIDKEGNALRPAMSYMDQRAVSQYQRGFIKGLLKVSGFNMWKVLLSLHITGGGSASVKDPMWKYLWVKENEPEIFSKVYKWLDVKEYLVYQCTGRAVMTGDSANVTFMYDSRKGKNKWSKLLCNIFGVDIHHMPEVVDAVDNVGGLTEGAAVQLGLKAGIPVFGGGGDASLLGVGAGAIELYDTHIYVGTSGWVSSVYDKRKVDLSCMIASIIGARPGFYNFFGEQETSGKCMEWVKNHLALDEIGVYLKKVEIHDDPENLYYSLYEYLDKVIEDAVPGSDGVIFTPWLHGNRAPFEDPNARGVFFNIGLNTGKTEMIRSVVEGIAFHKRWLLESIEKTIKTPDTLRFVGGGAKSKVVGQILSDILGKKIEAIESPQNAGAVGAAVLIGIGLGKIKDFSEVKKYIPVKYSFEPRREFAEIYDRNYKVFKNLYYKNKKNFADLNG
ncbi:MAG: FGGY-family carbohydrate kinase [Spirochaetales bacterium]|nr:FGGY-family carbohydrate kinase [Spirochaetales bacterium]